jgi:hypothetical protein
MADAAEERAGDAQLTGVWIGPVRGVTIREPGPDADGPVLEIRGEEGMAAMEFDDEAFVDGLTEMVAEMQMVFDQQEVTGGE